MRRNVPSTQQQVDGMQGLTGLATQLIAGLASMSSQNQPGQVCIFFKLSISTPALEDAFKIVNWEGHGINFYGKYIIHLRFAVDIVIMAETLEDPSVIFVELGSVSERVGFNINMDKTKIKSNAYVIPTPVINGLFAQSCWWLDLHTVQANK